MSDRVRPPPPEEPSVEWTRFYPHDHLTPIARATPDDWIGEKIDDGTWKLLDPFTDWEWGDVARFGDEIGFHKVKRFHRFHLHVERDKRYQTTIEVPERPTFLHVDRMKFESLADAASQLPPGFHEAKAVHYSDEIQLVFVVDRDGPHFVMPQD